MVDARVVPDRVELSDRLILLADLPSILPRQPTTGEPIKLGTVQRWARQGVDGVAPLATLAIGKAVYTDRPALDRFLARIGDAKQARRNEAKANRSGSITATAPAVPG